VPVSGSVQAARYPGHAGTFKLRYCFGGGGKTDPSTCTSQTEKFPSLLSVEPETNTAFVSSSPTTSGAISGFLSAGGRGYPINGISFAVHEPGRTCQSRKVVQVVPASNSQVPGLSQNFTNLKSGTNYVLSFHVGPTVSQGRTIARICFRIGFAAADMNTPFEGEGSIGGTSGCFAIGGRALGDSGVPLRGPPQDHGQMGPHQCRGRLRIHPGCRKANQHGLHHELTADRAEIVGAAS